MDKFMDGSNSLNLQPTACILGRGARERRHADLVTCAGLEPGQQPTSRKHIIKHIKGRTVRPKNSSWRGRGPDGWRAAGSSSSHG